MDYETIQVRQTDNIGIITLNRPDKRNPISIQVRKDIEDCLEHWKDDDEAKAVVFTGAGAAFSAGFDLKEFKRTDLADEIFQSSSSYHRVLWNFPKPTIAAINGPALGGGFDMTTLCDIRICSTTAIFGHPEIKFGAPPLYTPLRLIIGCGLARDLCFTGRIIDAGEARRIGLVSEVVDAEDILERAISIAGTMLEAPLPTLEVTKKYMIDNEGKDFADSFTVEHDEGFKLFLKGEKE